MKKYKWNDATLRKKSQLYSRLSWVFTTIALIVCLLLRDASVWWLLLFLIGVVVCYLLSGRVLAKDKQLKPKQKDSPF